MDNYKLNLVLTDLTRYADSLEAHIEAVKEVDDIDLLRESSCGGERYTPYFCKEDGEEDNKQCELEAMIDDLSGYVESLEDNIRRAKEENSLDNLCDSSGHRALCSFCPFVNSACKHEEESTDECIRAIVRYFSDADDEEENLLD